MTACKILILEDEAIIAMDMEMTLQARGFHVLGPCQSLDEARAQMKGDRPDLAVLDVNLGRDETSFAFAEELHEIGIPVLFLSGYSASTVGAPTRLRNAPRLMKPVNETELIAAIERVRTG